jgi:uncharacterized protein (DUF488 family)
MARHARAAGVARAGGGSRQPDRDRKTKEKKGGTGEHPRESRKEGGEAAEEAGQKRIWTIGHSTRPWDDFVSLLTAAGVRQLVDIRSYPGSRRYPHFNRETMETVLPRAGIAYRWMPALGGRRKPDPASRNTAWRNAAFRGYADYMDTNAFAEGLAALETLAEKTPTAYMCSEAVWWRCHRGLVSDALKSRGWTVLHIEDGPKFKEHPFTPPARLVEGRLTYEAEN